MMLPIVLILLLWHAVQLSASNRYMVEAKDSADQLKLFLLLGRGMAVRVEEANYPVFLSVSHELGNSGLYARIVDNCRRDFILPQLRDSNFLAFCGEALIVLLGSQLYQLNSSELDNIAVPTLYHILSHSLLQISSEDSLYSYIRSHLAADRDYLELRQFIQFEYLSPECVSDFISIIPASVDRRLCESISQRLSSLLKEVELMMDVFKLTIQSV